MRVSVERGNSLRALDQRFPPERRTQQERRAQSEDALLDSAAKLFARNGVDQTSLAEIGEVAGYSRGLVNHRFGSKAALVEQLAQRVQSDFVSGLTNVKGDEITALVTIVHTYLSTSSQADDAARAFFVMWGAALPSDAPLRPIFAIDDARFRDTVRDLLADGQRRKTVKSDVDPAGAAAAVVGMVRGIAAQFLINPDGVELSGAKSTCEQFIRSLGREPQPRKKR
jgi:AcrR family transcriptional regulator